MDNFVTCKYCANEVIDNDSEGLSCSECKETVHLQCLIRGSVPGGLLGDKFFKFICQECSESHKEIYFRANMTWFQIIVLVLYHLQHKTPGLAKRGYFHWKSHVAAFIDKNWNILFPPDVKQKKKWIGTISGTFSHYNPMFFKSGTPIFGISGWWRLTLSLTPNVIIQLNSELIIEKQRNKQDTTDPITKLKAILSRKGYDYDKLIDKNEEKIDTKQISMFPKAGTKHKLSKDKDRKEQHSFSKLTKIKSNTLSSPTISFTNEKNVVNDQITKFDVPRDIPKQRKLFDAFSHYNTSLQSLENVHGLEFKTRIMGGHRRDILKSPFTHRLLKPYIRKDIKSISIWTKLMTELLYATNADNPCWKLPSRASIDYSYVQPEHIPAINSLCAIHFWPGIDMTEALEYPDFSCVVMYKKLIVGFGFLIPDVKINEAYISFIFTRPNWRNIGIGRFIIYHLINTCMNKDVTLHVSINNPAIFLYQKFGFKVEKVYLDFYETYIRNDSNECKHAFFLRLER